MKNIPTEDLKHARRMRRFMMAVAASAIVLALVVMAWLLEMMERQVMVNTGLAMAMFVAAFFLTFRSGANRQFADPSLTLPQILASTAVILYVLHAAPEARGIFTLVYAVIFFFGVFRLNTGHLLGLTAFVAATFGLTVFLQWRSGLDGIDLKREVLRWIVLSVVLVYLSVMAGYVSRLRREAAESRLRLVNAMEKVEHMAAHDELTGALNRRSLDAALGMEQERAQRYGTTFSLCMMDLDFFKKINDTFGHAAGDAVLKTFAQSVKTCLRPSDAIGRYGGEEFVLLLPQTPLPGAMIVGERIRALCSVLQFDGTLTGLKVTVSIGVAEYVRDEAWETTIERADKALYRAKQEGRDRVLAAA